MWFFHGFTGTINNSWLTNQSVHIDLVIILIISNFCEHVLDFMLLVMHTTGNISQYHVHWKSQKVHLLLVQLQKLYIYYEIHVADMLSPHSISKQQIQ